MIKKVNGDILLSNTQAMAHVVVPNDHFNQGLALSLRERYHFDGQRFSPLLSPTKPQSR